MPLKCFSIIPRKPFREIHLKTASAIDIIGIESSRSLMDRTWASEAYNAGSSPVGDTRAVSIVVVHCIRIAETAVRFRHGPQWI